jgi:hypothetical protein
VALAGDARVSGSTAADTTGPTGKATSCAQVVAGTPATAGVEPSFRVPLSVGASHGGDHTVQVHVDVKGGYYKGPGTYPTATLDRSSDLVLDTVYYHPGPTTTGTVTVAADGSGSLTFADLVDQTGAKESGRISWTCGR